MNEIVRRFAKDCLTTASGEDYDVGRVLWALAVIVFLFLACWTVLAQSKPFDMQAFGTGLGLVMASGGAALWFKKDTELKHD